MDKDLEIFCVIAKIFKRSFEIDQNEKAFRDLGSRNVQYFMLYLFAKTKENQTMKIQNASVYNINNQMGYWLLKTEPENWSWIDQLNSKNQSAEWNGVRNYQASKNLKNMKKKDLCFFYHTGKEKKIVGIVEVIREHFKDKSDKTTVLKI